MTSLYTSLISRLVFPLHERMKGHDSVAVRRQLEETQWWPAERLKALQVERLRALLIHAGNHVPYYRDLFREIGFDPQKISSTEDLARLPFLTKPIIRANTERLKSEHAHDLARFNTGGSSGEPLIFYIGKERVGHDVAAKWRATRWWDVDIGDPEIVVWGSPIELTKQDRIKALRDKLLRTELLPAFEMNEANLDRFVQQIRARRPAMLFGYPSSLSLIAKHAEKCGIRMDDLGIRTAFVTSERLYDDQRETISRVFGCRVANGYGGRDAGFIAHECPAGSMHISAEDIVVEIVDGDGNGLAQGNAGEIIVTHLATKHFPFVRYRTGDVGVFSTKPCACGRGLPVLKEIQGRTTDFVVAQDGTIMHGLAVIYPVRDLEGIGAFKIVQESRDCTRVQVVPGPGYGPGIEQRIKSGLRARLGKDVEVIVEVLKEIQPDRSGKFRYIVSHVQT